MLPHSVATVGIENLLPERRLTWWQVLRVAPSILSICISACYKMQAADSRRRSDSGSDEARQLFY